MKKLNKYSRYTRYSILDTRYRGAFTLIEILIFTAIISVFFVVAAAVSAFSLSVMRTNENRVYATHYAEEANEWLSNEKDTTDWITFSARAGAYCMNLLNWDTNSSCPESGAGAYTLGSEYSRQFNRNIVLTELGAGGISASITVSWKDIGGNTLSVPIKTIYTQTE